MQCSTVIPTIGRDSLERTVRSALDQDIDDHEVIVVNDSGHPLGPGAWTDDGRVRADSYPVS